MRYNPRPIPKTEARHISYTGVRDSKDPTTAEPRKASFALNAYPAFAEQGGGYEGRPGFTQLDEILEGGVQLIKQFSKLDGTEITVIIAGGKFYTVDWVNETVDETLTAANLSSASVTLDDTARVYAVEFVDELVLTDGENTPWMWDGTANGGITSLTNAPVAFGPPTIYYAKLMFIKDAERTAFVWSEENQPNTGYEAGGATNVWSLGQSNQEALYLLYGTNEALFYWRARSMGAISGAVDEDFQTTGTHDGLSTTIGTTSPASLVHYAESLYFVDADAHPQRFIIGGGFQVPAIWHDASETVIRLPRLKLSNIVGQLRPLENVVTFAVTSLGEDENTQQLVFHADRGEFVGVWSGYEAVAQALVKNDSGDPTTIHGDSVGNVYVHGSPSGTLFNDDGVAIRHVLHGSVMYWDPREEKHYSRVDLAFRLKSNLTDVGISIDVPGCGTSDILSPGALTGALSIWGEAVWGESLWSSSLEVHVPIGLDCRGRWVQVKLNHDTLDEQFTFLGWSVIAQSVGSDPNIA
jgi:hypothetical protein